MVEPDDYQNKPINGSNAYQYTAAIVAYMMAAAYEQKVNYMIWDMVTNQSGGSGYNIAAWGNWIQPAIIANISTYPLNTTRPSNLP
jgi:hypothetical protein